MKKVKLLCIFIILAGMCLFACTCFFIPESFKAYEWCIGLSSALIILGLGYLVNILLLLSEKTGSSKKGEYSNEPHYAAVKHKSGYLVCKIMNVLLCIYLLILNELQVESFILILSIALVLIQYLLDLLLQICFLSRRKE